MSIDQCEKDICPTLQTFPCGKRHSFSYGCKGSKHQRKHNGNHDDGNDGSDQRLWFHFGRIRKKIYEDMSAINNVVSKGENEGDDG